MGGQGQNPAGGAGQTSGSGAGQTGGPGQTSGSGAGKDNVDKQPPSPDQKLILDLSDHAAIILLIFSIIPIIAFFGGIRLMNRVPSPHKDIDLDALLEIIQKNGEMRDKLRSILFPPDDLRQEVTQVVKNAILGQDHKDMVRDEILLCIQESRDIEKKLKSVIFATDRFKQETLATVKEDLLINRCSDGTNISLLSTIEYKMFKDTDLINRIIEIILNNETFKKRLCELINSHKFINLLTKNFSNNSMMSEDEYKHFDEDAPKKDVNDVPDSGNVQPKQDINVNPGTFSEATNGGINSFESQCSKITAILKNELSRETPRDEVIEGICQNLSKNGFYIDRQNINFMDKHNRFDTWTTVALFLWPKEPDVCLIFPRQGLRIDNTTHNIIKKYFNLDGFQEHGKPQIVADIIKAAIGKSHTGTQEITNIDIGRLKIEETT